MTEEGGEKPHPYKNGDRGRLVGAAYRAVGAGLFMG